MKRLCRFIISTLLVFVLLQLVKSPVQAVEYNLIAPSGQLTRGQNVQFTITVDTKSQSVTSTQIGMTYKSDVLQYVSATPGDTFTTVSTDSQETGKLIFTATSESGFSGTGTFAVVTFKLIATAAGSTELCVLFVPTPTPPPGTTAAPTAPVPTRLPTTGSFDNAGRGVIAGIVLLVLAGAGIVFKKKVH